MAPPQALPTTRIVVADDHAIVRGGLIALLHSRPDMVGVGEASTGVEAIQLYRTTRPDIVLMDLQMPVMGGLRATTEICASDPGARIVIVTTYSGDLQATRALEAGATAYLLKTAVRTELFGAIEAARQGQRYVCAEISKEIADHAASPPLTREEFLILDQLAAGASDRAIARVLSTTERVVTFHLDNIFAKLAASDRADAVFKASRRGAFDVESTQGRPNPAPPGDPEWWKRK